MSQRIPGIHHITAITGDPQRNIDFSMGLLGLRLVKKTVNFDDPGTYHFYYGDDLGRPTTILTFFSWPQAPRGRQGTGQIGAVAFSLPADSLEFWASRLAAGGVTDLNRSVRFGEEILAFSDPDGMPLELVADRHDDPRSGWPDGPVPDEHAIRGFHGATLWLRRIEPSAQVLTATMGFTLVGTEGDRHRYAAADGGPGAFVDLLAQPQVPPARQGVGTVHHIAWRTHDDATQLSWLETLTRAGLGVTPVQERQYFRSIYYREPGGVLYEIATDVPGFTVDESPELLGTDLKLPPWLESQRPLLEQVLPPVHLPLAQSTTA